MEAKAPEVAKQVEPKTHKQLVREVFNDAVKAQIGGNKEHGWGIADSSAVIDQIIANFHEKVMENKGATGEMMQAIEEVINPSQFRQKLESAKILTKGESKRERKENLLDSLTS